MGLPSFSTEKPVTTIMIFLGVVLFGVISLAKLPQELFPPIAYPQLTVFTGYANAAPEEVETLLTRPVEEAVGTVSGLQRVSSVSREGISLVIAEFGWDQNMDFASLRTREKVDLMKARLPRDATEPLVVPFNPFELPVMTISVTGDRSPVRLRQIANDIIKQELEKIDGVASASVEGGLEREILVNVDQGKLLAYDVPIIDVSDAITDSNLNYPAGTIKETFYEYLIRTLGEFKDVREIEEAVIKNYRQNDDQHLTFDEQLLQREISRGANIVQVKDVASVEDTVKERSSYSRFNGMENISVSIQKQAQVNTMHVIQNLRGSFSRLEDMLPPDIQMDVIYDQSVFISDAINGVRDAAFQGGILAFFVLLFFLGSFRAAFIVTLSIPISIMVVFTFMYFGGISINMMSLGGLALGVGMLVDNAVVVIENIFRHKQLGAGALKAAREGTQEVSAAISASTLTTIAVFMPMIFVVGVAGQLFKELAFTVTFSLIASLWVALTLIPLLSSKMPEKKSKDKKVQPKKKGEKWDNMLKGYGKALKGFLAHKGLGLFVVGIIFVLSLSLFGVLEKELMPRTDEGQFIIRMDMPVGTKLEVTNQKVSIAEEVIVGKDDVESVSTVVGSTRGDTAQDVIKRLGSNQGQIIVTLEEDRTVLTTDFVQELERELSGKAGLEGVSIEFSLQAGVMAGAMGGAGKPVSVEVKGDRLEIMEGIAENIIFLLEGIDGIFGVEADIPEPAPEIKIEIDKDKASLYNISVVDLARAAQTALRGFIPSRFKEEGREIDIRVRVREEDRDSFAQLHRINMHSPVAGRVPLGTIARFVRGKGPSEIKRLGQERTITVDADVLGRKLSEVLDEVEVALQRIETQSGYRIVLAGESEQMEESFDSLRFALILSLVMVYMIMASQFESLTQPLIILFTVPLSIIGVLAALYVTETSLNVVAFLGVIMLGGIVVNNGIVLIDYTNLLMQRGASAFDAVIEASCARLRPILMTALTTVLGLFPMALAVGRGSELRSPMAISVMGGLIVSTFFTLAVIPAVFLLEKDCRDFLKRIFNGKKKIKAGA